jgi:hypothetical protein
MLPESSNASLNDQGTLFALSIEARESNVLMKMEIHPKTPNTINPMRAGSGLHTKYMHVAIQAIDGIRAWENDK